MKGISILFLILLSVFGFILVRCQVSLSNQDDMDIESLQTWATNTEIPTKTAAATITQTPDLIGTSIAQSLAAPTTYAQSYYLTLTAAPVIIDPLIIEYSGTYYYGEPDGHSKIIINPNGLFEFSAFSDIGGDGLISGELSVSNGHFILTPKLRLGNTFSMLFSLDSNDEEIIPILWGERRYLTPVDEIAWFCNQINAGREPRDREVGFAYLNLDDITKIAGGLDEFPDEINWCILQEPITGIITKLDENRVTINLGSEHGVFERMFLHTNTVPSCSIFIDAVDAMQSSGNIYSCDQIEEEVTEVSSKR